jgi:hypothetical protein
MPGVAYWPLVTLFYHALPNAHHAIALRPEGAYMAFNRMNRRDAERAERGLDRRLFPPLRSGGRTLFNIKV